ncbi:DsbA family oxidoreductase [Terriglobus albidus]|uniref:DsbA family oxidoreductase n=1 Tax=Terriglobus albidus TaxID=1592106 RepID=UPI0021E01D56|nr:DsbA family protein [Terriglobus albidus]
MNAINQRTGETSSPFLRDIEDRLKNPETVLHWYDLLCPFCYIGQHRTGILVEHGLQVMELPFQAHPEIPPEGTPAGPRIGPMYSHLEHEAKAAGLPLHWPARLPDTRRALAAAEWVRRHQPEKFPQFHKDLFAAHFVHNENLGDPMVIERYAAALGIDLERLNTALSDGSALWAVTESEMLGREYGVRGTPAWLIGHQLISGALPPAEFERLADAVAGKG